MFRGLDKYKLVYRHLWQTYGASGLVRWSFIIRVASRACKLIALPIALSQIITRLSAHDYDGAYRAVGMFVGFSLLVGILVPLTKYVGMLGENKVYASSTKGYFSRLVHADLDYFHANLSGYLTAATRQYVDSCVQLVRALRDRYIDTILGMLFPLVVIFWLDAWLGLVALGLSLVQAYYLVWASHSIASLRTRARELFKYNSGRMADIIANILAVRSTAQEDAQTEQIGEGAAIEARAFQDRYTKQAKLTAVREFITVTFFMVLLWLTVNRMSGGHIDIGAAFVRRSA